jgi:hypothetical protein
LQACCDPRSVRHFGHGAGGPELRERPRGSRLHARRALRVVLRGQQREEDARQARVRRAAQARQPRQHQERCLRPRHSMNITYG